MNHLQTVDNVESYFEENGEWKYSINPNPALSDSLKVYFIVEKPTNEAFAHWVFETVVNFYYLHLIHASYPNIKILLKEKKIFKELWCKYLNIEFTYSNELNEYNKCFFAPLISLSNSNDCTSFERKVDNLFNIFDANKEKTDYLIFLPRQTKENYRYNDRVYQTQDLEKEIETRYGNKYILKTDDITDLRDQISQIQSTKNIILTDGSPLLVNGMFANNSTIYVIGSTTPNQCASYSKMKYLYDKISQKNTIVHIPENNCLFILKYLKF